VFAWGTRTLVVGIVNCSPDSFSGDGHGSPEAAVAHGLRLVEEGADLLDVGGQSTRPSAASVSIEEERRRVLPVIEALVARSGVPVSVDTSRAAIAVAALQAGAALVNDVRALLGDPDMAAVLAAAGAGVVLMDNRLSPPGVEPAAAGYAPRVADDPFGEAIVPAVAGWLAARVAAAEDAGIRHEHIVVDPGLGFGKTTAQSLALLRRLPELRRHAGLVGVPLMVGSSRKGFIGRVLGLPPEERVEGTLATLALAIAGGADLVRVHDVRPAVRCCRVADAVVRASPPASVPGRTGAAQD
jgi:dihydropteroate synthase